MLQRHVAFDLIGNIEPTICYLAIYGSSLTDCMLLSYHVRVWEWIYTLQMPDCQGTPCSKQARYLKFKWQQQDSNPQPFSL